MTTAEALTESPTLTANETAYLDAARKCQDANGGCFAPCDLWIYGYDAKGDASLNGTTGSLVAKGVILEPEDGWSCILTA